MTDLGKSNAQWLRMLGEELGYAVLSPERLIWELMDRFRKTRTQVAIDGWQAWGAQIDTAGGGCTFSGVKYGVNTDKEGRVWVRVTGTGPYTVSVYTAASASGLVAQGSGAADATVTLSAQNSSGMTGTWKLPSSVTADTSDNIQLLLVKDFPAILLDVFDEQDGVEDDPYTRAVIAELYAVIGNGIESTYSAMLAILQRAFLSDTSATGTNRKARLNAFNNAKNTSFWNPATTNAQEDGGVTVSKAGAIAQTELNMADETTGSTQTVLERNPSAGSVSYGSNNAGSYAFTVDTPEDRCKAITVKATCIRGVDTGDLGNEAFSIEIVNDEDESDIPNANEAIFGQPWAHDIGISGTLARTLSKTNDGSNNIFTAASNAVVTGESNANTDSGVLYWETTGSGPYTISFYKGSARDASDLVAQAASIASGTVFTATAKNASGIQVAWQLGGTESATNGQLDLNPPKVDADNNGTPDQFEFSVTVPAGAGLIQTGVGRLFGGQLNSASSSETISDSYVKAGTFPPYAVQDN